MSKATNKEKLPKREQSFKIKHVSKNKLIPIVGIGASAGGLEAFTEVLKSLPIDIGMTYVLIQHLDPTHESVLTGLLSRTTKMPVTEVKDSMPVEANHVYVIPPNSDMTITDGVLKLTPRNKDGKPHLPIDHFFRSLAASRKENAIGVILSGTASDGTLGLKVIKAEGGITFAQDETAKYQGMPKAAIDSGCVDFVLPPAEIANELSRITHHPYIHQLKNSQEQEALIEGEDDLKKIFLLLHKSTNVDFSHYKIATIKRRIMRRMLLHKLPKFADYVKYLKENSGESELLHQDLLINVTSFFRDPQTFKFLKDIAFPRIAKNRTQREPIRVWVPGCATGEEAYSIAISLSEYLGEASLNIPIQVFGSDLNKNAIEKARKGVYSKSDIQDITPQRLERFFVQSDGGYQIVKSIRDLCIFAPHNVFADPPFSRLDLISCCNLLIYLDSVLQEKLFHIFHYALRPKGFLMLGKSESVGNSSERFSQIDKKFKVYSRKEIATRGVIDFRLNSPQIDIGSTKDTKKIQEDLPTGFDIQRAVDSVLLNQYTPASVVINNDLEIIQFRGLTGDYLEPATGKASFNLMKMARNGLGFELRSAISKVRKNGKPFRKEGVQVKQNGKTSRVILEVLPLKASGDESYYLVLFQNATNRGNTLSNEQKVVSHKRTAKDREIEELKQELSQVHEDMRSVTEEQEATNEELQSASEEVLSSNEELQSINEELETSKEELESTNEELTTVNEELQNRNQQLTEVHHYAEAIIRTVQVPLLILDSDLRVKTANRAFYQTFQVSKEDTEGNFIFDLGKGQWNIPALRTLLNEILPKDNVFDDYEVEHTFPTIGHKIMLLNARKFYKDGNNILLAIDDITERKSYEDQKDEFTGIVSHELKTPITTMKAFTQILQKRISQSGDKKDAYLLSNINTQADRLTNLINDLLNVSKIGAGKLSLDKKRFDLDSLVKKVVVDFQYTIESHSIIKEGDIKEMVYGDESRIEQVISNLITNAVKYSPQANKVIITLQSDKQNAIVKVQDFGFGIAKKDQRRIFDRFYRTSDKEKNSVSGFGLGLYISCEIIKRHNGKIWVDSTKGKGSTFSFSVPLKEV
jgi:two-component system CheB/CheR fusion protein